MGPFLDPFLENEFLLRALAARACSSRSPARSSAPSSSCAGSPSSATPWPTACCRAIAGALLLGLPGIVGADRRRRSPMIGGRERDHPPLAPLVGHARSACSSWRCSRSAWSSSRARARSPATSSGSSSARSSAPARRASSSRPSATVVVGGRRLRLRPAVPAPQLRPRAGRRRRLPLAPLPRDHARSWSRSRSSSRSRRSARSSSSACSSRRPAPAPCWPTGSGR